MQPYQQIVIKDFPSVQDALGDMSRKRLNDITDRDTFPAIFVLGRKVAKVPSGSADVVPTDRIGDCNTTADYAYFCVSDGGSPEAAVWRRIAMATW